MNESWSPRCPAWWPSGEGGLLGIALDPLFMHSGHSFVYAYLTAESDNRIVRFNLDPDRAGGLPTSR